jgi:multimeric flavodoxin WrbA
MRNILLINLSPRTQGTSFMLLQKCADYLTARGHLAKLIHLYPSLKDKTQLLKAVNAADTLILGGPCYVNTYPAETLTLLEELSAHKDILHGQSLYGIIQGGMPYAHTHESGLALLEIFGLKCNVNYKGGFVMGLGAMLNGKPLEKLLNGKTVIRQFEIFSEHISRDENTPKEDYLKAQFQVPVFIFRIMAIGMNRRIKKDLQKRGIDINQKSPYLVEG